VLAFFRPEAAAKISKRTLTFAERVGYQRVIEEVYWRHRIWPKENPHPKPPLNAMMSQAQLETKVEDYLRKSQFVADQRGWPITASELQAEMQRMASRTKQPDVLRELFEALGNDPFVVAECLARPVLVERLLTNLHPLRPRPEREIVERIPAVASSYTLPTISGSGFSDDTWTVTSTTNAPDARFSHTAVWTGSEMIVWGGYETLNTGGRYNPSTDSWTATSTTNAPSGRDHHTAVWTGSEMIVWGGYNGLDVLNTGGRYNPSTNSWTATSTTNAPFAREFHTAVWSGGEMIVWGGYDFLDVWNTGGRYNPSTDSWTATSTTNAPDARFSHTAVWTGSEMIAWGGYANPGYPNTGGRYNPSTDSWTATSTANAPNGRSSTAVWTGSEMIVWGGTGCFPGCYFNTGGRYNPATDSWTATSITNAPSGRQNHTAVWTASEMIVWGGALSDQPLVTTNTGGRYDPGTDSWTATGTGDAPSARYLHTAVWSGSEMIAWGGLLSNPPIVDTNTGGRYCAATPSPTPTPTPTPTSAPRSTPTPRPRPSPAPRP
jgi:N-acetylneuraminic acid mutarotase